mmetsp:Transcript_19655/g.46921  ORF Transcript_19655/g.46921 Transcript_19655/m.46921 type:complete len:184 (+) Transcript_19655:6618-7169(+)
MVLADIDLGLLYIMGISGIGVYGVLTAGWASNTKYAFLGSLRSAAQMISYEVSLGLILMSVILCAQSLNFTQIVEAQQRVWYVFPLAPLAVLFFISALAETNRSPFDLPEAEAELVSGFNVEYSAMAFALFFLGEYGNMILMSSLATIFFLGGWLSPFAFLPSIIPGPIWFGIKTTIFLILFV